MRRLPLARSPPPRVVNRRNGDAPLSQSSAHPVARLSARSMNIYPFCASATVSSQSQSFPTPAGA